MEHEEDSRESKRHPHNSRTAHSVSVFLPSEWDPLPFTIDRIFTMYYRWSSDFDAAVHVTLPRVGFITRIGGDRLKLSFSPEGLEEFLRAWNAYHNVVPGGRTLGLSDLTTPRLLPDPPHPASSLPLPTSLSSSSASVNLPPSTSSWPLPRTFSTDFVPPPMPLVTLPSSSHSVSSLSFSPVPLHYPLPSVSLSNSTSPHTSALCTPNGCKIRILCWNINGRYLANYLCDEFVRILNDYDVILLQETRLRSNSTMQCPYGFTAYTQNRRQLETDIECR
ncbi:hypothetical protein F5877DRAFT_83900 [Lentinula edodes]|nr:hypothetical protein F5877DRAFT_83900 [Lentinula edodes]